MSAPAACCNKPGRVDVFAGTVDLAKAASGPVDLAIASANRGPTATARDLSYATTTLDANDYYQVGADDRNFASGGAKSWQGWSGLRPLNAPIVAISTQPHNYLGDGYRTVASDGGIFAFGDAQFYGSSGNIKLNSPVVGIAATSTGHGYLLAARDGGAFAYGNSQFEDWGVSTFSNNVVDIINNGTDTDYYLTSSDGHVANYGTALNYGDIHNTLEFGPGPLNKPVVGMSLAASTP